MAKICKKICKIFKRLFKRLFLAFLCLKKVNKNLTKKG